MPVARVVIPTDMGEHGLMSVVGHSWRELGRLIEMVVQLRADEAAEPAEVRQRDARIAETLPHDADRAAMLDAWLEAVRTRDADAHRGRRPDSVMRGVSMSVSVVGGLLGAIAAGVVFAYTGNHPINVVTVLAVFVGVQLVALLLTVIGLTPAMARRVPGWSAVQELASVVSPGRLAGLFAMAMPRGTRRRVELLLDESASYGGVLAPVQRAALLAFAQGFGLAFNVAAIAFAVALVVSRDLAFGWSTTLAIEPATAQRIVAGMAWPWGWAWPAAVPSLELIEATRYFRVEGVREGVAPESLGRWWPFVVMSMASYGVMPRLIAWATARRLLAKTARQTIDRLPGVSLVVIRLERRGKMGRAGVAAPGSDAEVVETRPLAGGDAGSPMVVAWAGAPCPESEACPLAAGGGRDITGDRDAIAAVRSQPPDRPVMIVTKAWEPPLAELFDFADELRRTGEADGKSRRPIWLLPVGVDADGVAREADDAAWQVWRRTVSGKRDAGLRLLRWNEVTP